MYRHIINLLQNKNLCIKLVNYYDYTVKHRQQNIEIGGDISFVLNET